MCSTFKSYGDLIDKLRLDSCVSSRTVASVVSCSRSQPPRGDEFHNYLDTVLQKQKE
jgi:hypothetical protein